MSLANLFHFLCAQHVLHIKISIIRSLQLYCWITTSVVLFCKDGGSWWWKYWCPKNLEHLRSEIKQQVTWSWSSILQLYVTFFMHPSRPWLQLLNIHNVNYDSLLTVVNIVSRNKKTPLAIHFNRPSTRFVGLRECAMIKCLQIFQNILDALYLHAMT